MFRIHFCFVAYREAGLKRRIQRFQEVSEDEVSGEVGALRADPGKKVTSAFLTSATRISR